MSGRFAGISGRNEKVTVVVMRKDLNHAGLKLPAASCGESSILKIVVLF